jgi:hypothetical protein
LNTIKFKKSNLAIVIALLASSQSFAYASNEISLDLNIQEARAAEQKNAPQEVGTEVSLSGLTESTQLSQAEIDVIKRKKHLILKHLYEQSELESLRDYLSSEAEKNAFDESVKNTIPFSPEQVTQIRIIEDKVEKAKNEPLKDIKLQVRTIDVDVDSPTPIELNVYAGYASSIVFYDQTGSPWPIEGDILGNDQAFSSQQVSENKHIGAFEILKNFSQSNALVNLKDLPIPIVIKLVGSSGVVDSRVSVRIPKAGPNAKFSAFSYDLIQNVSPEMLKVLNGDKLIDSQRYALVGVDGEVTYKNGLLYIRTQADLMNPPPQKSVVSASGYKVYQLSPTTNLMFSVDGKRTYAEIEKAFDVKIKQKSSIFNN